MSPWTYDCCVQSSCPPKSGRMDSNPNVFAPDASTELSASSLDRRAAIFDGVDGYIARHYNQRSELGAILDPLADKLLLVSAIVLLSFDHLPHLQSIPLWLTGTIIGRDILLLVGLIVIQITVGKVRVRPRVLGKIATVLQMIVVLWILLKWENQWLNWWMLTAAICTGISGLLYIWDGTRQLSAHPASSASSPP